MTDRQPDVSFIIPVRNDAARLAHCLDSIRRNASGPDELEVVVVDNASTDESPAVAAGAGARVLTRAQGRVSELRNFAASTARGKVLAFVDADHEIVATWTRTALDALHDPEVGAVGALCVAPPGGTWVQRAYGYLRGVPAGRHDVEWLGSGNLAVKRSVFESIGGFDTSLEACEDVDLCRRISARGFRVFSDAGMKNIHFGDPDTLWNLFKGEMWRGRDNLRVSLRGPITWRALPSIVIPVVDSAMLVTAGFGLAVTATGQEGGLVVTAASAAVIATAAGLKAVRAWARHRSMTVGAILTTFIVAGVYDLARAAALLMRVQHRRQHAVQGAPVV